VILFYGFPFYLIPVRAKCFSSLSILRDSSWAKNHFLRDSILCLSIDPPNRPKLLKIPNFHVTSDKCHAVTLSQKKKNAKNAQITYVTSVSCTVTPGKPNILKMSKLHFLQAPNVTMSCCHTVTQKRPKILKMQKKMNFLISKYFCNCDTVTLCDTALCNIFNGHLKNGQRHGMDTYLLSLTYLANIMDLPQAHPSDFVIEFFGKFVAKM
jgi:hypothetical protein